MECDTSRFNKQSLLPETMASVQSEIQYDPACTYLLCIGRLVKDKGIRNWWMLLFNCKPSLVIFVLLLVGSFEELLDPLPAHTLQQIRLNAGIIHIQWTDKVEYFLQLANHFVFPSHREGFPNVLLQAACHGITHYL
jgi:glycosyltransferase involved in cell wall biosynthesis